MFPFSPLFCLSVVDPICGKPINKEDLSRLPLTEVPKLIAAYNNSGDDKKKKEDEGQGSDGKNKGGGE